MTTAYPTRDTRVFKRLVVDTHFNVVTDNRVLVEWALEKGFVASAPGPYQFSLWRGYAANDDHYIEVARGVDQPWLYDAAPVLPGKGMDLFYRVTLTDSNGNEYVSQAVHATTYWERYDWSLAKEIIRKEHMLMRKRTGTRGWLLKRRLWGQPCDCVDAVTGEISDPQCETCYGTGITGGYYEPYEYWLTMNPSQRVGKLTDDQGFITHTIETVRGLAYPAPVAGDLWVHAHTDQRYLVQSDVAAIVRHRGINLVLNMRLEEQPRSHPVYQVPTPCS